MTVRILIEGSYINEVTRHGKVTCRKYEVGETVNHWSREYEQFCIGRDLAERVSVVSQAAKKVVEMVKETFNAAPSTIDFAKEVGVNLSQVEGTGVGGRILKADVEKAVEQKGSFTAADLEEWPKA